jgi:excisionase family DNA binding protein
MPMTAYRPAVIEAERLPLFLTVEQVAEVLGTSRTAAYDAIHRGEIPSVRFGRRIRIPRHALLGLGMVQGGGQDAA